MSLVWTLTLTTTKQVGGPASQLRLRGAKSQCACKLQVLVKMAPATPYPLAMGAPLLLPVGVHNNLFTNINTGAGTRPWQSGGAAERGADAGERSGAVDAAG